MRLREVFLFRGRTMKKLGGRTMKKLVLLVVVLLMAQLSYGLSTTTYTCGFESGEQGTSFVTGALNGQGSPAWAQGYYNVETGGSVINTDSYSGSQSAVISGYQCARVDLGSPYIPEWFEYAFKPMFDSTLGDVINIYDTSGVYWESAGIWLSMNSAEGTMKIWDKGTTGWWKVIGQYTNNEWQTISFRHEIVEFPEESGEMIYSGYFDVYLNGQLVASNLKSPSDGYYAFETMIFFTSESTWAQGGTVAIDGINVGETPIYTIPEPATMGLLAMGLGFVIRRKRA
jgi:hypothetical protein